MTITSRTIPGERVHNRSNTVLEQDEVQACVSTPSTRHLTETDLARRWRMSVRTLQSWRWRKIGPPYLKALGKVLYRLSDIKAFEADHLRGGDR